MGRLRAVIAAAGAAMVAMVVVTSSRAGPDSAVVLGSEEEFESLRSVVENPSTFAAIRALALSRPLARITTVDLTDREGGGPESPSVFEHYFDFAEGAALSTRRLRVTVTTVRRETGFHVDLPRSRFVTVAPSEAEKPSGKGIYALWVLRAALNDNVVAARVGAVLRDRPIAHVTVSRNLAQEVDGFFRVYDVVFFAHDNVQRIEVGFRVEFDTLGNTVASKFELLNNPFSDSFTISLSD
jgi:hypothetical protein